MKKFNNKTRLIVAAAVIFIAILTIVLVAVFGGSNSKPTTQNSQSNSADKETDKNSSDSSDKETSKKPTASSDSSDQETSKKPTASSDPSNQETSKKPTASSDSSNSNKETNNNVTPQTPQPNTPNEEKRVDLVMFMGQSNMAGRGVASASTVVPEGHGYEFRAISNPTKLYPVLEPFGVNENNEASGVSEATKTGSMVSSFIAEYYQQRKVPIVGVSCSKGGTGLDFWAADGAAVQDAIERHDAAKAWLEKNGYIIENDFMVWCQGETDGGRGMDSATYVAGLKAIIEKMVSKAGIDFCAVIRIGHANGDLNRHIQIIEAQTELCKTYDKAVLVSTKLAGYGPEGMKDEFHYTQPTYNVVGQDAGKNTAYYIINKQEPSMYDPQYKNQYMAN